MLLGEHLQAFLRSARGGQGIYSVCSAHAWVIEAAMRQARADGTVLLLEATSNQVNQMGGYTQMTPRLFRDYVHEIADRTGFDCQKLILGGDHLGPNPWQHLDAKTAMMHATEMVRLYVEAGFSKIHLDASMRCADDPAILSTETMAGRAAELCASAETSEREAGAAPVVFVVGTEVPTPGGATHALHDLQVTSCEDVRHTLEAHNAAFRSAGVASAWDRVIAVVVQPGVEFGQDAVVDYAAAKAAHLQELLREHPELVFEAHSSDYQNPETYKQLIRDGFAILKVGPALTFALREALYSLAAIERELVADAEQSHLVDKMDEIMLAHPANWKKHYHGDAKELRLLRMYSYSDRIRYYWGFPEVQASVSTLLGNLRRSGMPAMILSQYFPRQYAEVREGRLQSDPEEIVIANIRYVLQIYSKACHGGDRS